MVFDKLHLEYFGRLFSYSGPYQKQPSVTHLEGKESQDPDSAGALSLLLRGTRGAGTGREEGELHRWESLSSPKLGNGFT